MVLLCLGSLDHFNFILAKEMKKNGKEPRGTVTDDSSNKTTVVRMFGLKQGHTVHNEAERRTLCTALYIYLKF